MSAAARERVTVALSGDGGDELWAGYARHSVEHWEAKARRWLGTSGGYPRRTHRRLDAARASRARDRSAISALTPADACAQKARLRPVREPARGRRSIIRTSRASIGGSDPLDAFRRAYDACPSRDPLDRALYVDVKTYLVDDILTKVDKMSMAVSLEARVPLLDHRLLEFAATVPAALKLKNGPAEISAAAAPRRTRFRNRSSIARSRALRRRFTSGCGDRSRRSVNDLFFDGRLRARGVFDERAVARLWREHRSGAAGSSPSAVEPGDARVVVPSVRRRSDTPDGRRTSPRSAPDPTASCDRRRPRRKRFSAIHHSVSTRPAYCFRAGRGTDCRSWHCRLLIRGRRAGARPCASTAALPAGLRRRLSPDLMCGIAGIVSSGPHRRARPERERWRCATSSRTADRTRSACTATPTPSSLTGV